MRLQPRPHNLGHCTKQHFNAILQACSTIKSSCSYLPAHQKQGLLLSSQTKTNYSPGYEQSTARPLRITHISHTLLPQPHKTPAAWSSQTDKTLSLQLFSDSRHGTLQAIHFNGQSLPSPRIVIAVISPTHHLLCKIQAPLSLNPGHKVVCQEHVTFYTRLQGALDEIMGGGFAPWSSNQAELSLDELILGFWDKKDNSLPFITLRGFYLGHQRFLQTTRKRKGKSFFILYLERLRILRWAEDWHLLPQPSENSNFCTKQK